MKNTALKNIYKMQSLQGFAFSMIGIFIPIYLITLGYSVTTAISYFILHYFFLLCFSFFSLFIARKIGLIQTITLRFPFLFTYLILLHLLQTINIPIIFIAIFSGLESALFWIPLHIIFSRNTNSKEIGTETGRLFALPQIAGIAGPFIGGLIAANLGFNYLIIFVSIILLGSVVPLLKISSREDFYNKPDPIKLSNGKKFYKKYKKYFFADILDNFGGEPEAYIWPIFAFLTLKNIEPIGVMGTLFAFGSAILALFIGKLSDKISMKKIFKLGAFFLIMIWIVRITANNETTFYILSLLAGFAIVIFTTPYTSMFYKFSHDEKSDDFFVWREIPNAIGRISIMILAILFVNHLNFLFPIAGLAYIYFLFL